MVFVLIVCVGCVGGWGVVGELVCGLGVGVFVLGVGWSVVVVWLCVVVGGWYCVGGVLVD